MVGAGTHRSGHMLPRLLPPSPCQRAPRAFTNPGHCYSPPCVGSTARPRGLRRHVPGGTDPPQGAPATERAVPPRLAARRRGLARTRRSTATSPQASRPPSLHWNRFLGGTASLWPSDASGATTSRTRLFRIFASGKPPSALRSQTTWSSIETVHVPAISAGDSADFLVIHHRRTSSAAPAQSTRSAAATCSRAVADDDQRAFCWWWWDGCG